MRTMIAFAWIVAVVLAGPVLAAPHTEGPPPIVGEDGICIPVYDFEECSGPGEPPAWCTEYDPEYGDWLQAPIEFEIARLWMPLSVKWSWDGEK